MTHTMEINYFLKCAFMKKSKTNLLSTIAICVGITTILCRFQREWSENAL